MHSCMGQEVYALMHGTRRARVERLCTWRCRQKRRMAKKNIPKRHGFHDHYEWIARLPHMSVMGQLYLPNGCRDQPQA